MRVSLQPALVLHRQPYRNSSLLVEALSRDHGRVGLVARGVRSRKAPGVLRPFQPLLISWSGRGELYTLGAMEEAGNDLQPPPSRLLSGLYLNELLYRLLLRHDPQPMLFQRYLTALASLCAGVDEQTVLRIFEKHLLALLGYGLVLEQEGGGIPVSGELQYHYELHYGPRREPVAASLPVSGRSLLALAHEDELTDPQIRAELKRLTRAAIAQQLDGRPLKTRELARARRQTHENPG